MRSTIRTTNDLRDALDGDFSWRRRELSTIHLLVGSSRKHQSTAIRRAAVTLLYAHWEGFVKKAGTHYVEFVSMQRLRNRELAANFLALSIKSMLQSSDESNKAAVFTRVADFFVEAIGDAAKLSWVGSIQTKSNLRPEIFKDIMITLGLDYKPYELKEKKVIERLCDVRNDIAHGKEFDVDLAEYEMLHKSIFEMLEAFRDQIDVAAQRSAFARK